MMLLYVSILLIAGLVCAKLITLLKFPAVTGYLLAGILIGPHVLGLIPKEGVVSMEMISEVALAFVAFSIGSEMKLSVMKRLGTKIMTITLLEALGAFFVVLTGMLLFFHADLAMALTLAAIACATAPAATLLVIREYRAKGELVDVLLPVVALDDAICIIVFGIASQMAVSLAAGGAVSVFTMVLVPVGKILAALLIGVAFGTVFARVQAFAKNEDELLILSVGFMLLLAGISKRIGISDLLCIMSASVTTANIGQGMSKSTSLINRITPVVFVPFFVLAGADLNLPGLLQVGALGVFYILARTAGKYAGAYLAARATGFSKKVYENLGLTLIPQAGVAIGLSLIASRTIPAPYGEQIRTIILSATIVYELAGPLLAKIGLRRAGAIRPQTAA